MSVSILIVDSNPEIYSPLKAHLDARGYDTRVAQTPEGALEEMGSRPANFVLVDDHFPRVLSGELLPAMRVLAPFSNGVVRTVFIAISPNFAPIDHRRAGFVYVTRRPFDFDELDLVIAWLCIAGGH